MLLLLLIVLDSSDINIPDKTRFQFYPFFCVITQNEQPNYFIPPYSIGGIKCYF
jgi:hypothetical protein